MRWPAYCEPRNEPDIQLLQLRERQLFDAELFGLFINVGRHAGEIRVVEANDLAVLGQPEIDFGRNAAFPRPLDRFERVLRHGDARAAVRLDVKRRRFRRRGNAHRREQRRNRHRRTMIPMRCIGHLSNKKCN